MPRQHGGNATAAPAIMGFRKEVQFMTIADRIQSLRKTKGFSQEELADRLGVSRQAVSKWESEQSSPDLERIVYMSELFGVTTDYILRGIEPPPEKPGRVWEPKVFVVAATALNLLGLLLSAAVWYEYQSVSDLVISMLPMFSGCVMYGARFVCSPPEARRVLHVSFWKINIWLLAFIPLSVFYNALAVGLIAPYPLLTSRPFAFGVFWLVYIVLGLSVDLHLLQAERSRFPRK